MREWYERHPGYAAASERRRREKGATAEYDRWRWENDPAYRFRKKARIAFAQALKRGKIQRQPCERCGAEPAEGHHPDYSKPLEVRWLCVQHHIEQHRQFPLPFGPSRV
jgi:hypothetical protein